MKTLLEGQRRVRSLLGKQIIKTKGEKYRFLKYLLHFRYENGFVLYNVITGRLLFLNSEEEALLQIYPISFREEFRELVEEYFLVPEEFDEKKLVNQLRLLLNRLFTNKGISRFTIFTTTNCNARCFYCYEHGLSRVDMGERDADRITDYILKHKSKGKIKLSWFGGEPLIGVQRIDQICRKLIAEGVEFESTMTSNGYLFDADIVKRSVTLWRLKHVQISLDGIKDTYNRVKAYIVKDENPYGRVLDNITLLLENGIAVTIRLNIDWYNINEIRELGRELSARYGRFDNISVYPHFILQKPNQKTGKRSQIDEDNLVREQIVLKEYLSDLGINKPDLSLPIIQGKGCGADCEDSIVIYPDGRLYKCIDFNENDSVGRIDCLEYNENMLAEYRRRTETDRCSICPIYPYCIILSKCPDNGKYNKIYCDQKIKASINNIRTKIDSIGI